MQKVEPAVNAFISSLEKGYKVCFGSIFCELFTRFFYFNIWGGLPKFCLFDFLHSVLGNYFGATFGEEPKSTDLGFKHGFFAHALRAF